MTAKVLTPLAVKAVKSKSTRCEIPDGGALGLYLVVQPSGAKSWAHRYPFNGARRKDTLGGADDVSLAEARRLVAEARHLIAQGVDPTAHRRGARAAAAEAAERSETDSVAALAALFVERYAKRRLRTWTQTEDTFRRLILPKWRGRTVHDIRRRHVIELVEGIAVDNGPHMANRTLAVLSRFFKWLVARDVLESSPASGVDRPGQEVARDRTLTGDELRRLLAACDPREGPFGVLVRLLALTGQRRGEVGGMRWSEIGDDRIWRLPGSRTKNGKPHQVPLAPAVWDLIQAQPRFVGSDYVLAASGARSINFAHAKRRLSTKAGLEADSWRLHDLRRSCASGMQRLGVRAEVVERCLNHVSGVYRGVAGIYQRDPLIVETTAALERWAGYVEQLTTGKSAAKIVKFGKR